VNGPFTLENLSRNRMLPNAAIAAKKGGRCVRLLVCGVYFDLHVHEQTQRLKSLVPS
jgi:hypothetical protein